MANDSSTGGYLAPVDAQPPPEDAALDAIFQQLVVGVTGLPGSLVRPRWQPVVPKQPEANVNWCAIGVSDQTPDASPAIQHNPAGDGSDTYIRHEDIDVMCSFYGPGAKGFAQMLVDGLCIAQNIEQIKARGMAFVSTSLIRAAPDLVNEQWIRRYDLTLHFRRAVTRTYAVLNILSAQPDYHSDNP
ncbi:hypothetical protein [Caballeronia sp. INDeC2]|uniref:phage neck terminator protein n=1 Tax=Caballeronia sp. INDeC2 TaxID=2921747 RepID=UPI002028A8C0|nr:hypothetical protein [Caballeronia sp. INDeC2]